MSVSTNFHNPLIIKDLPRIHKKIAAAMIIGNESRALELINSLKMNNLEQTLKGNYLGDWSCTLLETAEARKMTRIVNLLKEIN